MKKILITGKNSYIGTSIEKWLAKEPENYQVDTVDTRDDIWKEKDFSPYDVVFHVAGIAHVSTDPKLEDLYYRINRDLTVDIAKKAKDEGVNQFIFMSSIIVYGNSRDGKKRISKFTEPNPSNFYGKSKLQAENGLLPLETTSFKVVIIRPPMIYGRESKGNYPRLSKFAKKTLIFPDFSNKRSLLYIDNLSEFVKVIIDNSEHGIWHPQNKEIVQTSKIVKEIADYYQRKIWMPKTGNFFIKYMLQINTIKKIFGDLYYDETLNTEYDMQYQLFSFKESIIKTETRRK